VDWFFVCLILKFSRRITLVYIFSSVAVVEGSARFSQGHRSVSSIFVKFLEFFLLLIISGCFPRGYELDKNGDSRLTSW